MGLDETVNEGSIFHRDLITLGELKDRFGDEIVRRGLEYMVSLEEADENYRDSADSDRMEEGYQRASGKDELSEEAKEGTKSWARSMEESGIGIKDE